MDDRLSWITGYSGNLVSRQERWMARVGKDAPCIAAAGFTRWATYWQEHP